MFIISAGYKLITFCHLLSVGLPTTHFFGFFTGKQNVSETMPFGENSHSAKFQADISNSF